jgi:hypothetical protein
MTSYASTESLGNDFRSVAANPLQKDVKGVMVSMGLTWNGPLWKSNRIVCSDIVA